MKPVWPRIQKRKLFTTKQTLKKNIGRPTAVHPSRRKKYCLHAGNHRLPLGEHTRIMGIVNVTPDSFSHDGCLKKSWKGNGSFRTTSIAVRLAQQLIRQGADIIDVGGESTRPGARRLRGPEEIDRVIPVIQALAKKTTCPISVDTYKSTVAERALDAGATIVNNIMGVKPEKALLKRVRDYNAAIVLMHIQGTPRTMQKHIHYRHLVPEIIDSLKKTIENCLEIGIKSDKIIIDPGIGFGKTVEHNLEIINRLNAFQILNQPLLIGTSRKSFIGKVLDREVNKRLTGTVASVCTSICRGAHIVRVHDVSVIKEAITLTDAILNESYTR